MEAWQRVEVLQLGPAGPQGVATGGSALHDEIYSWPNIVSPCLVDQQLVGGGYAQGSFFDDQGVDLYGLDTLEYLLFHPTTNACPSGSPINADGSWDALVASGFDDARGAYARAVAGRVVTDAEALASEMRSFRDVLAAAGEDGNPFSSAQAAVDELYAALFYLELRTKDLKLAVPLGLHIACTTDVCPEKVESPWASLSMAHVATNIDAGLAVYRGGDGLGFDDMITDLGGADLAEQLDAELVAARDAAAGFEGTLADAVSNDPARARAVFDALKAATDTLKADAVTVLNLRVPDEGAGDND
jgi:predicted lipoprotein